MTIHNTDHDLPNKESSNLYLQFKVLIVSFLFSLMILFVLARPIYMEMKTNKDQIKLIQKNLDLKNSALASLENFSNEHKNIKNEELIKVKSLLQGEDRAELYIANINKISQLNDSDMEIVSLSMGEIGKVDSNQEGGLVKATIDFSLIGEYSKLIVFLGKIEKLIPLVNLESLEIEKNDLMDDEVLVVNLESLEIEKNDLIDDEVLDYKSLDENIKITANIVLSYYYK